MTRGRAASVAVAAIMALAGAVSCTPVREGDGPRCLGFASLEGWAGADHAALLRRLRVACADGRAPAACPPPAGPADQARGVLERHFVPVLLPGAADTLVTGYYEPVIDASPVRTPAFPVPIHAPPADTAGQTPGPTRAEIAAGALDGQGRELLWLPDRVARFFLQVQGSGRLRLPDGRLVRVGYAGRNGHPYRSIGRLLVERGVFAPGTLTADLLRDWLRADPSRGARLMEENPSYVYFREVTGLASGDGPVGSAGVPLTPGVSAAVDPAVYPLGTPLWLEVDGPDGTFRRLLLAEDTGSAIRGPARVDLFHGTGEEAGRAAGRLAHRGRLIAFAPRCPGAEAPPA